MASVSCARPDLARFVRIFREIGRFPDNKLCRMPDIPISRFPPTSKLDRIGITSRRNKMEYLIGVAAATGVGLFASVIGFDKDHSFYPVVLIVIATLYLLFAAMAGSTDSFVAEAIPALMFVAMAAFGFKKTPWLVVAGLALHGVFDFFHHAVIANPGVPVW